MHRAVEEVLPCIEEEDCDSKANERESVPVRDFSEGVFPVAFRGHSNRVNCGGEKRSNSGSVDDVNKVFFDPGAVNSQQHDPAQ